MKPTFSSVLFILLSLSFAGPSDKSLAQEKPTATYQVFYDALAPYGKWLYDKQHGYVWTPSESNFRPYYSNGYWAMTDVGCTWISNYPWGWAPFHYGRWVHDAIYKWIWVPGNKWASAWVVWKTDGQYAGWVPILPGTSLTAAVAPTYYVPADWWVFIKRPALLKKDFKASVVASRNNGNLIKQVPVNLNKQTGQKEEDNYLSGIRPVDFAKSTGQRVTIYTLRSANKPGKGLVASEEITLYMPVIEGGKGDGQPAKYSNAAHAIGKAAALSTAGSTTKQPAKKPATKRK